METWIIAQMMEVEAIKIEVEGMKAENLRCTHLGFEIFYTAEDFEIKAQEVYALAAILRKHGSV
jgi:hypothetical protein